MRSCIGLFLALGGTAWAGDFYVNPHHADPSAPYDTPATAALHLTNVLPLAVSGDTIHFFTGTYVLVESVVVTNDITFVSTNPPGAVVIDGGMNSRCFTVENSAPAFHGLTMENGQSDAGGAMSFYFSAAVLSNCIIRNSSAKYGGGLYADQSPLTIMDCLIQGNTASNSGATGGLNWPQTAGGGLFFKTSSAVMMNSVIANNKAVIAGEGGGIGIFHPEFTGNGQETPLATTKFLNCVIISNVTDYTGGGTACLGINFDIPITRVHVEFEKCRWEENQAQYGGAFYHVNPGTQPFVANSLFLRNHSQDNGAALRIFDTYYYPENRWSRCTVVNSTFVDNQSPNNHTIYVSDSIYYMANNIVWSNQTLTDVRVDVGNALASYQEAEYNCLEREYTGKGILQDGNITNHPAMVDVALDDFRLTGSSPCIDAGLSSSADEMASDYFGDHRIFGNAVDMGFDEAEVEITALTFTNSSGIIALCPPVSVLSFELSDQGNMENWTDMGLLVTSATDRVVVEFPAPVSDSGAIRAVWLRP